MEAENQPGLLYNHYVIKIVVVDAVYNLDHLIIVATTGIFGNSFRAHRRGCDSYFFGRKSTEIHPERASTPLESGWPREDGDNSSSWIARLTGTFTVVPFIVPAR
jgi:hypothetical protein